LSHAIHFATRNQIDKGTAIDIIFVDDTRLSSYSTYPIINGLSKHESQNRTLNNIAPTNNILHWKQRISELNNERIMQFQLQLANLSWESIYV
jgi:cell division inhibitor SulA